MPSSADLPLLLDTHLLEKTFADLRDELERETLDTVDIPLMVLADLLGPEPSVG